MSTLCERGDLPDDFTHAEMTGPFVQHLGLKLEEVNDDRVAAHWEAARHLQQPYGIVHGGVHCSVVETLASVGAAAWWGARGKVVAVTNTTDFFRPVSEGRLRSVGTSAHRDHAQQVWVVETRDAESRLVARGYVRLQNLQPQD